MEKVHKKRLVYFSVIAQIFLIVSMSFAFAFLMSNNFVNSLSSNTPADLAAAQQASNNAVKAIQTQNTAPAVINPPAAASTNLASPAPIANVAGSNPVAPAGLKFGGSSASSNALPAGSPSSFNYQGNTYTWDSNYGVYDTTGNANPISPSDIPSDASSFGYTDYKIPGLGTSVPNPILGNLAQGLGWSITVVGIIQLIGSVAGLSSSTTTSLSISAVGGIMGGKLVMGAIQDNDIGTHGFVNAFGEHFTAGQVGFAAGIVIAAAIFILTYKTESKKLVNFQCLPYESPLGGSNCEQCNKDPFRPCTEYRCRFLGRRVN